MIKEQGNRRLQSTLATPTVTILKNYQESSHVSFFSIPSISSDLMSCLRAFPQSVLNKSVFNPARNSAELFQDRSPLTSLVVRVFGCLSFLDPLTMFSYPWWPKVLLALALLLWTPITRLLLSQRAQPGRFKHRLN